MHSAPALVHIAARQALASAEAVTGSCPSLKKQLRTLGPASQTHEKLRAGYTENHRHRPGLSLKTRIQRAQGREILPSRPRSKPVVLGKQALRRASGSLVCLPN